MTFLDELSQFLEQCLRVLIMLQLDDGVLLLFKFSFTLVQFLAYERREAADQLFILAHVHGCADRIRLHLGVLAILRHLLHLIRLRRQRKTIVEIVVIVVLELARFLLFSLRIVTLTMIHGGGASDTFLRAITQAVHEAERVSAIARHSSLTFAAKAARDLQIVCLILLL